VERRAIFRDDRDRWRWLELVVEAVERFGWSARGARDQQAGGGLHSCMCGRQLGRGFGEATQDRLAAEDHQLLGVGDTVGGPDDVFEVPAGRWVLLGRRDEMPAIRDKGAARGAGPSTRDTESRPAHRRRCADPSIASR